MTHHDGKQSGNEKPSAGTYRERWEKLRDDERILFENLVLDHEGGTHFSEIREHTGKSKSELKAMVARINSLGEEAVRIKGNLCHLLLKPTREEELETLRNFAQWALKKGYFETARKTYFLRYLLNQRLGDEFNAAQDLGNAGVVCMMAEFPHQAAPILEQALELHEALGDLPGIGRDAANLGSAYTSIGEPEKALKYLEMAIEVFEKAGEPEMASKVRLDQAKLMHMKSM